MTITLGFQPYPIEVVLARDGAFTTEIVADDPWPDGVAVELRFSATETGTPVVWPGEVSGSAISWDQPPVEVAAVLDAGASHVRLVYIDPDGDDLLWGRGRTRAV